MTAAGRRNGIICALISNCLFGFSNYFSAIALRHSPPMIILSLRFITAFAVMSLLWAVGIIRVELSGRKKGRLMLMCVCQPLIYFICELYGIKLTSSALSGVMIAMTSVTAAAMAAVFLKESVTPAQTVFAVISVAALILLNLLGQSSGRNTVIGVIILVIAVISASAFNVLARGESENTSAVTRTYVMFLTAAVGFTFIALCMYGRQYFTAVRGCVMSLEFDGALLYLAVLSSIAAYMLYNYALDSISVVQASSFSNIIPVVSVLSGILLLGERFTTAQLICFPFIIAGVCGVNLAGAKKRSKQL